MKTEAPSGLSRALPVLLLVLGLALNGSVACFTAPRPRPSAVPETGDALFLNGRIAVAATAILAPPGPGSPANCTEVRLRLRCVSPEGLVFKFLGFDSDLELLSVHPSTVIIAPGQDVFISFATAPFDPGLFQVAGTVRLGWGNRTDAKALLLGQLKPPQFSATQ